jgi:hypothetical protein
VPPSPRLPLKSRPSIPYDRHGVAVAPAWRPSLVKPIVNPAAHPINHAEARPVERLLRILVASLFGLLIVFAWVGLPFDMPFIGYGLVSAFVFQIAVRPRRWEIFAVVLGATALILFDQFFQRQKGTSNFKVSACLGFLGLVSFMVMGFRAVWAEGQERQQLKSILVPAAAFSFFILGSQRLLNLGGLLFPNTTDLYAYAFDGSLGFQPSSVIGSLFQDYPVVGAIGRFTYYSLPLAMALLYAAHLRRKKTAPLFILEIFMAAGLFGYFLYLMFPATGPIYVVSGFPATPLSLSQLHDVVLRMAPVSTAVPRNAMPSLHMAWALLIWFNCKSFSRPVRALAFLLVLTTIFDTLGTGEHYFIDLVVAFPFAVAVQALCTHGVWLRRRARLVPLLGGASLTLLWPVLVHYGSSVFLWSPVIPWACVIASTALTAFWMRQLLAVAQNEPQSLDGMARATTAGA